MSSLNVFFEDVHVGALSRGEDLTYSFVYSNEWLSFQKNFPLSLAMPLQTEAFGNRITLSFFENLLPEAEVRDAVTRSRQIEGPYEFLREYGEDCAGAIIVSSDSKSPYNPTGKSSKVELNMARVYDAITNHHSVAHAIAEMDPGYLSLAGAQDKFPAIFENGKFFLPTHAAPTTHIVKVPIHRKGVKESVFNEYYCMQLAALCGFNIPSNQVIHDDRHPLYVVERYDRYRQTKGLVHRLHQQDFCQAQGIISEKKYEAKGGPSIKDNYDLIVANVSIKERLRSTYAYLDWICFNLLIGNNDSHSKNLSFLLKDKKIELAPFYDLMSTALYTNLKKSFSFKVAGRDDFSQMGKNQFETLDIELGLKIGTMKERLQITYKKMADHKDTLAKNISSVFPKIKIADRIADLIEDRAKSFKRQGLGL